MSMRYICNHPGSFSSMSAEEIKEFMNDKEMKSIMHSITIKKINGKSIPVANRKQPDCLFIEVIKPDDVILPSGYRLFRRLKDNKLYRRKMVKSPILGDATQWAFDKWEAEQRAETDRRYQEYRMRQEETFDDCIPE